MDLSGVRVPTGAPGPGECLRVERPEPGLVRFVLAPPHRPKIAVFDVPLLADLDRAVEALAEDREAKALVITGRSPLSFVAGADIDAMAALRDVEVAARFVREVQGLFQRVHRLGRGGGGRLVTVAAVGGPVLGGACELALACDRIVLADDPRSFLGLPEVKLGIFPAWGGSTRLPRRIGLLAALPAILQGSSFYARKAYSVGLVDRLAKPEYLARVAADVAMGRERLARRGIRGWRKVLIDKNPLAGLLVASRARGDVMKATRGHYPAPLAALPIVVRAPRIGLEESLRAELEAVRPLAESDVSKSLLSLFRISEDAKKLAELPGGGKPADIRRAAVIGAGVMGGAIAGLLAEKGAQVRLRDLDQKQLDAAQLEHERAVRGQEKRKRLQPHEADAAIDRLELTREPIGFGRCDFAIEAVAERLEVKRAVLGEMARMMAPGGILATNTSSLSVDAIAAGLPDPERVIGMHFFNPVRKMPLVEIVRGARTSDETVARVAQLAVRLGKTPVVTKDCAGFLVNRVLGPYLDEAIRLVAAGYDPIAIDQALVAFGMPMGPCELLDEVGLDIAQHAGASLEAAYGERMKASRWLAPLVEGKQLGKKTGAGIYAWSRGAKGRPVREGLNPRLPTRGSAQAPAPEKIAERLVLAMVDEAARSLEEGVVAGPRELDLATVFGMGFAPFRGGVLRFADSLGARAVVSRLRDLAEAPDPAGGALTERKERFVPASSLVRMAEEERTFHG